MRLKLRWLFEIESVARRPGRQPVGWVERSDTHHVVQQGDGFRKGSTHPTGFELT
jgi:hypothetical protein